MKKLLISVIIASLFSLVACEKSTIIENNKQTQNINTVSQRVSTTDENLLKNYLHIIQLATLNPIQDSVFRNIVDSIAASYSLLSDSSDYYCKFSDLEYAYNLKTKNNLFNEMCLSLIRKWW